MRVATAAGLHSNGGFGARRVDKAEPLSTLRELALANLRRMGRVENRAAFSTYR